MPSVYKMRFQIYAQTIIGGWCPWPDCGCECRFLPNSLDIPGKRWAAGRKPSRTRPWSLFARRICCIKARAGCSQGGRLPGAELSVSNSDSGQELLGPAASPPTFEAAFGGRPEQVLRPVHCCESDGSPSRGRGDRYPSLRGGGNEPEQHPGGRAGVSEGANQRSPGRGFAGG